MVSLGTHLRHPLSAVPKRGSLMKRQQTKRSVILQVAILFAVGVIVTGLLTYGSQRRLSESDVKRQTESLAANIAEETASAVKEYPAYKWLIRYWYEHADTLDIEYDVDYSAGTLTEEKCRQFRDRHPDLQPEYASTSEIQALTDEDQKLYAEIIYSWLITRVNQIKRTYHVDFLFCVLTDESFESQFFLFSAADPGAVRGNAYEEVYPLGNTVKVSESQRDAMDNARQKNTHLADAGDYLDYYSYLGVIGGRTVLIGITFNLTDLRAEKDSQALRGTVAAIVYQLCLSLICLVLLFFVILRPLKNVQNNIHLYMETKDSASVVENLAAIKSRNEIGQLSEDVADLTREIDDYLSRIETITKEKERISADLALATRIQSNMLPNTFPAFPNRPEFDIYAGMEPAREVGGDFYDYLLVDEDHLYLVIADVSGKGVPAALFMMMSQIIFGNHAMLGMSPAQLLTESHTAICDHNQEEMFVTAWLGILELSTGRLTAANAGHEYPVLKRADGAYELLKDRHGLVVGGMDGVKYKEYELFLSPGDKLFLYTDGVPEATDSENRMFGTDRMLAALNADPAASPEQVLKNVRAAVDAFVQDAEQFDDLTMLCMEYKGPSQESTSEASA